MPNTILLFLFQKNIYVCKKKVPGVETKQQNKKIPNESLVTTETRIGNPYYITWTINTLHLIFFNAQTPNFFFEWHPKTKIDNILMQHLDMAPTEVHDQKPVGGPSYAKKSKPATNLIIPNCWDFSFLSVRILFYLKFEVLNLIRISFLKIW